MDLEHANGLIRVNDDSHAIKANRQKKQNPALQVAVDPSSGVVWTLIGLHSGEIEDADPNDIDHLDFYIFIRDFRAAFPGLPLPAVAPSGGRLRRAFPWGSEGVGKPLIKAGRPLDRFAIDEARMRMRGLRAQTVDDCSLNIDFERAPYPDPGGGPQLEVHFGVSSNWQVRLHRGTVNSVAIIEMSNVQYANVYNSLATI